MLLEGITASIIKSKHSCPVNEREREYGNHREKGKGSYPKHLVPSEVILFLPFLPVEFLPVSINPEEVSDWGRAGSILSATPSPRTFSRSAPRYLYWIFPFPAWTLTVSHNFVTTISLDGGS